MKKIITILAAILINSVYYDAFSQTYNGAFYEMFFEGSQELRLKEWEEVWHQSQVTQLLISIILPEPVR